MDEVEQKLTAARTRLILDKPFLGALTLRLPLTEANPSWCPTTATDARRFYYSRDYIDALSLDQVQFVLAHEALHCALSHFARRNHRDKRRWDVACDFAVNPLLLHDELTPPPGMLYQESFDGMTAEEIYPCIDDTDAEEPMDRHVYHDDDDDGGGGSGGEGQDAGASGQTREPDADSPPQDQRQEPGADSPPRDQRRESEADSPSRDQRQESEAQGQEPESRPDDGGGSGQEAGASGQTRQPDPDSPSEEQSRETEAPGEDPEDRPDGAGGGAPQPPPLNAAEQEALAVQWQQRLAGAAQQAMQAGKLGGAMARMVDHLLQPQLPWRMLLARYMTAAARDDYSYTRPSARREGPAIYPSLRSSQVDMVVALDTSGSLKDEEIGAFLAEVNAIKSQVRARVTLLACDAELEREGPWRFEPWEEMELPKEISGGGGTRFAPVFDWVEREGRQPDLLVYFTDAKGQFPPTEPAYPTLWLVKGKAVVPWGQRIQLN